MTVLLFIFLPYVNQNPVNCSIIQITNTKKIEFINLMLSTL